MQKLTSHLDMNQSTTIKLKSKTTVIENSMHIQQINKITLKLSAQLIIQL